MLIRSGPAADAFAVVPAVLALVTLGGIALAWPASRPWIAPATAAVAVAAGVAAILHPPHAAPREAFWILAELGGLLLLLGLVGRWAAGWPAVAAGLLATAAGALALLRVTDPASLTETLGVAATSAVLAAVPVGLALYLGAAERRRARSVVEARRAQRLELAHDLHDFVAHDVTGMVVQAQAAQIVADRSPAETLAALKGIEEAGLHALDSLDRTVHALRAAAAPDDPAGVPIADALGLPRAATADPEPDTRLPGIDDIVHLAGRFAATDRVSLRLETDPIPASRLTPGVAETAHRVVREALTNVRRHAADTTCIEVRLTHAVEAGRPAMIVSVTSTAAGDGGLRDALRAGPMRRGLGLTGLAERVAALGGRFSAGPLEGVAGWRVTASLPLRGERR